MMKTELVPFFLVESKDFHDAWVQAISNVLYADYEIEFNGKKAYDSCQTIILDRAAVLQIERFEIHKLFPFKKAALYAREFTRDYLDDYMFLPRDRQFSYLYFDRIVNYHGFDQIKRININDCTNRNNIIIWQVEDQQLKDPPCLQRIWLRRSGNYVDLHLNWRSRDLFAAWQVNLIGIVHMLYREILRRNGLRIGRIIDQCDSLHIYKHWLKDAESVEYDTKKILTL
jgi:thymidylate synthase